MKKTAGVLLGILMVLMFVSSASAAWTYEQTFNNLNNGDLNGQDSWSGAVQYDVQSVLAHEGAKALQVNAVSTSKLIERTVPSFTSGQVYFSVRRDTNSVGYFGVYLRNSTAGHVAFIYFKPDGNISAHEGVAQTERVLGTYIANTWYRIGIDYSSATDQYRANINNGAWSPWYDAVAATTEINQIKLYADGNANSYFDFVGPNYAFGPTISSVSASSIAQTSATITWTTDVPATSQVEYGLTTAYGTQTTLDSNLVTNHSVNLSGLTSNTTYHYRVKSKDAANNEAISGDYTFHTVAQLSLRLPFRSGESWQITQGNSSDCTIQGNTHCPGSSLEFAWDFSKAGAFGSDVLAPASGKVIDASDICSAGDQSCNNQWGNYVIINYGSGYYGKIAHLHTVSVKIGQYVFQGEKIGTCGSTGNSTGAHIHYQTQSSSALGGQSINPLVDSNAKFVDSGVPNGIPVQGSAYTSSNTVPAVIYHFDSTSDASGNNNTANMFPGCLAGGCLSLNGTNDYLETPSSTSLQTAGDLTIVFWLRPENVGSGRINPIDKAYFGEFSLVIETDGSLSYYHGQNTSSYFSWQALAPGSISNNQGIRVVITRDGSQIKSYINGVLIATSSTYSIAPSASTNSFRIGLGNTAVFYKGKMDELAIYPRMLTDNEINNDYYSSKP